MKFQGQKPGAEQGKWFRYLRDEKTPSESVDFLVRGVPAAEERRMDFEVNDRKRPVAFKKGKLLLDVEKQMKLSVKKACFALLDSRNADIEVKTDEDARVLREGLSVEAKVGDTIRLDGKWSEDIKEAILSDPEAGNLVRWIIEKAGSLEVAPSDEIEDEEALGKI